MVSRARPEIGFYRIQDQIGGQEKARLRWRIDKIIVHSFDFRTQVEKSSRSGRGFMWCTEVTAELVRFGVERQPEPR